MKKTKKRGAGPADRLVSDAILLGLNADELSVMAVREDPRVLRALAVELMRTAAKLARTSAKAAGAMAMNTHPENETQLDTKFSLGDAWGERADASIGVAKVARSVVVAMLGTRDGQS